MPFLSWQSEKIYYKHQDYFDDMVTSIQSSRRTIEVETYILDCDRVGNRILQELKSAAERGVRVRVVVDGFGSFFEISKIFSELSQSAVQMKVYHPFLVPYKTRYRLLRLDIFIRSISKWNRRLHRKICLIDGHTLFLGSFNITDNSNRETGVQVTGAPVAEVQMAFNQIWNSVALLKNGNGGARGNGNSLVRLNDHRKNRRHFHQDLCQRMNQAKKRIWITNAYFVPPPSILKAIAAARQRGVSVEILVPTLPDPRFMKLLTETYYRGLLNIGVRIFEYQREFLHAKSLLIDKWAIVGSSNMNYRSLFQDLEVDVVLTLQESLSSLENQFAIDRGHCIEVTIENILERRWLDKIFTWFLMLLREWM